MRNSYFWLIVILTSTNVYSQNCDDYVKESVDEMTDKKTILSKERILISSDETDGFIFDLLSNRKGEVSMLISVYGAGNCIDKDEKAIVLFSDSSKTKIFNMTRFNCKNQFMYFMGGAFNRKDNLEMLSTKKIIKVRVYTENGLVEEEFSDEQAIKIKETFKCLVNYKW